MTSAEEWYVYKHTAPNGKVYIGVTHMKPTDIWTNHPDPKFKPPCNNGDPCHVAAPRGAKTGTQGLKGSVERSRIPKEFCNHIVTICESEICP